MVNGKRTVVIWGMVWVLLSVLACSFSGEVDLGDTATSPPGGEATTEATAPPAEDATAVATADAAETEAPDPPPPPTGAAEPTIPPQPTLPPETVEEKDPLEVAEIPELEVPDVDPSGGGLGHLSTFRQRMNIRFTAEDSDYTSVLNYGAEVNTGQGAVHVTLSAEGAAVAELPANTVEAIWIGNAVWVKIGNQPWVPIPESVEELPFDEQVLAVGDFMPYIQYFQKVDERSMNGVQCAYYTYTADNVPSQYGTVSGTGAICVALEGGYVVHYTLDGYGTFTSEDFFQGSGTFNIVYDTYDVGADIDIRPPRGR